LDHARADYDSVVAQAQAAFGERVLPVYLRQQAADGDRLVGLLTGQLDPEETVADAAGVEERRAALIEGVIEESEDETLMERYLGGEQIDRAMLVKDLEHGGARGGCWSRPGGPGSPAARSSRCFRCAPPLVSALPSCWTWWSPGSPRRWS